jgi:hypothetical protein
MVNLGVAVLASKVRLVRRKSIGSDCQTDRLALKKGLSSTEREVIRGESNVSLPCVNISRHLAKLTSQCL